MPYQIRPVRDIEVNIPSVLSDNPNSLLLSQSVMQSMFLNQAPLTKESGSKNFDSKSKDLLYSIWNARDTKVVEAQSALKIKDVLLKVPSSVSSYDVLKLASEGLVINKGFNLVAFTDKGKLALGLKIMEQPSEFERTKTKSKFVFSQTSYGTGGVSNQYSIPLDPATMTPDKLQQLKTLYPDLFPEGLDQATLLEQAKQLGLLDPAGIVQEDADKLGQYVDVAKPIQMQK